MTVFPIGYGTRYVTIDELRAKHEPNIHPEFGRRLFAWIEAQNGRIGIGSGYRPPGTQPDATGYAPPGSSFHEGQEFPSGRFYAAVDLVAAVPGGVHRAPRWSEVPIQGSAAAAQWGVHCNIGNPSLSWPAAEPWHMQPVELDGHGSWKNAGCPDLQANYGVAPEPYEPSLEGALAALAVVMTYCACVPGGGSQAALWDVVLPHIAGITIPVGDPRRTEYEQASKFPGNGRLAAAWAEILKEL